MVRQHRHTVFIPLWPFDRSCYLVVTVFQLSFSLRPFFNYALFDRVGSQLWHVCSSCVMWGLWLWLANSAVVVLRLRSVRVQCLWYAGFSCSTNTHTHTHTHTKPKGIINLNVKAKKQRRRGKHQKTFSCSWSKQWSATQDTDSLNYKTKSVKPNPIEFLLIQRYHQKSENEMHKMSYPTKYSYPERRQNL